jgi:hypothetical protein
MNKIQQSQDTRIKTLFTKAEALHNSITHLNELCTTKLQIHKTILYGSLLIIDRTQTAIEQQNHFQDFEQLSKELTSTINFLDYMKPIVQQDAVIPETTNSTEVIKCDTMHLISDKPTTQPETLVLHS